MEKQYAVIVSCLKKLGFSEYESKSYLKLLEKYPVNGYTLSKDSGVPRSRIYEVLKSLGEKQMVFEQVEGKNTLYHPVEPKVFLRRIKTEYEEVFADISGFTEQLYQTRGESENLVVISGRRNIIDFVNLLIKGAEKRIAISIWQEDIEALLPELKKAMRKGVVLRGIYFGADSPFDTLVPHRRLKRYMAQKKERYISLIVDGETVLSGIVSKGDASKATWTREKGFIEMSEDFIAHDLVVNLYSASLPKEEYEKFEKFLENVYHHYYSYSDEQLQQYRELL